MTHQECNIDKINKYLTDLQTQLNEIAPSKKPTSNKKEEPIEEKRSSSSWGVWMKQIFKKTGKVKKEASNHASDSGGSQGGSRRSMRNNDEDEEEDAELAIEKLQSDILQMINAFKNLNEFQDDMRQLLELDLPSHKLRAILRKTDSMRSRSHDLKEIRRKVFTLKCQIPSLFQKQSSRAISITDSRTAEENDEINETGNDIYLPGLYVSEDFKTCSAFKEVVDKFQGLEFHQQLCLLSFAVFPENKEVKRTMLMYWWIGEDFINCDDSENSVTRILNVFSAKKLLEPVEDERKLRPSSYKMNPHVHSAVIYLAKTVNLFELYNSKGKLTMRNSYKEKICLVKGSSLQKEAKVSAAKPGSLKTVFNSSERYPDFTFKWFPLMNSLKVLYLGRWERTAKRHIEVESTEFLKYMKSLKNLRLASFQGISRIEKLEDSICELPELIILDLRACYNLEALPNHIGLFEKLIYLDVSECYMLDRMPKGIAKLSRLQVLKGFVVSESDQENNCAVKHLLNLKKLSITVNKYSFKVENLMESLLGLKQLESLKIAWGARFREGDKRGIKREETNKVGEYIEATNEENEIQGGPATKKKLKDMMEQDDDHAQRKGEMSEEKNGDSSKKGDDEAKAEGDEEEKKISHSREATETIQNKPNDKSKEKTNEKSKSEVVKEEIKKMQKEKSQSLHMIQEKPDAESKVERVRNREKEKEGDKVEATKSELGKVVEGVEKTTQSQEAKDAIKNKTEEISKVEKEGVGDKGKADPKEETKHEEVVEAGNSKSDNGVEGDEKTSPPQESDDKIQNKTDDKTKVGKEGDEDKGKGSPKEETKHEEVKEGISKSDNGVKKDEKTNPPQESNDTIKNRTEDKTKVEKEEEKGKGSPKEETKHDEVKEGISKSENGVEKDEKTSPPQESNDTIQNKTDDKTKVDKEGDEDKGKVGSKDETKHDEVKEEISKSDNNVKKVEKTIPPQESNDTIQNKTDDKTKVEKEGDEDKRKVGPEDETKNDEVKEEISKPNNGVKGDEKTSPSRDDIKENSKVQEKGGNNDLEEVKNKNEVKSETSKTPQESKDTIQKKEDDDREITKADEKGDGVKNGDDLEKLDKGEAKTQKPHKTNKFGKKVSFQKKSDDMKNENAMAEEIHETASPSRKAKSSKTKLFMKMGNKTKKWAGWQENPETDDTSKLPSSLKKLELECFPDKDPPSWLNPKDLDKLEKLSIRGGNLSRISDENQWPVQILRLKYLHEFEVEWKDLHELFPNMTLLEKYKCPKISFCPTDGNGVWRKPQVSPNP